MAGLRRFAGQVTYTAVSHGLFMVALVISQLVLARTVPVHVFGALAIAQAVVALAEMAVIGRSGEVALQVIGEHWGRSAGLVKGVAGSLRRLDALYAAVAYVALVVLAVTLAPALKVDGAYLAALGLAIPAQIGYGVRRSLFIVADDIRGQAVFEMIYAGVFLALTAGLTLAFGVWGMIAGSVSAAAVKNLVAHLRTRRHWAPVAAVAAIPPPLAVRRAMRVGSLHSLLRNLFSNATSNADVLLLGLSGRPEMVAIYKVARTLAGIPLRMAAPSWVVLRPRLLSALLDDDHARFCSLILRMAGALAAGLAIATPLALLFGGPTLQLLYGKAYGAALEPFLILFVGMAVFGAVTGWLPFTLIISSRKTLGSAILALQLAAIVLFGALLGGSAIRMAWVVAACNVAVSAVAWAALLAGAFRHAGEPQLDQEVPTLAE